MAGTTSYYHCDASGNVRALTDSNQNVTDRYTYDAFGNTVAQTGTTENNFRFGGRVGYHLNPDSGSYYVRQREYQPAIIRWISEDPIAFESGDFNLYRYAGNNPSNSVDSSGLATEEDCVKKFPVPKGNGFMRCVLLALAKGTGTGKAIKDCVKGQLNNQAVSLVCCVMGGEKVPKADPCQCSPLLKNPPCYNPCSDTISSLKGDACLGCCHYQVCVSGIETLLKTSSIPGIAQLTYDEIRTRELSNKTLQKCFANCPS